MDSTSTSNQEKPPVKKSLSTANSPTQQSLPEPAEQFLLEGEPSELLEAHAKTAHSKLNRNFLVVVVIALLLMLLVITYGLYRNYALTSKAAAPVPTVKIGLMAAFSGGSSNMGHGIIKGVELAKKQLQATNIEFIQVDSKCDPDAGLEAMQTLIAKKVVAIIGDSCSSVANRVLTLANQYKILMLSPSASSPSLSIPDDYFFRVIPPDNWQGAFLARTIFNRGIRRVAVFYSDEPYGRGVDTVFKKEFEALGGTVAVSTHAPPGNVNLASQVSAIELAQPEAVLLAPNNATSTVALLKLMRQNGIAVPYFGADFLYEKTIITNAGQAAEGLVLTTFPTGTENFKQLLDSHYQSTDLLYASAQAYDAFETIYRAISRGAASGEAIRQQLLLMDFQGVSARILFDKNGEIANPDYTYDILTIRDGEFVLET